MHLTDAKIYKFVQVFLVSAEQFRDDAPFNVLLSEKIV
jgi:hypothetical protein